MDHIFTTDEKLRQLIEGVFDKKVAGLITPPSNDSGKEIYTTKQAAEKLCMSEQSVRKWVKHGKLKIVIDCTSRFRFHHSELERFSSTYWKPKN